MNRRGFLGGIAAFAAACTLDPERALWVRGAKTISIAAPSDRIKVIQFEMASIHKAAAWIEMNYGGKEVFRVAGQSVFPVYAFHGGLSASAIAYILPDNWRSRIKELNLDGGAAFPYEADIIVRGNNMEVRRA